MYKNEDIKAYIASVQKAEGTQFLANEPAIIQTYTKEEENKTSLAIKVLAIFGGFLASLAFLGFLFITGIFDSGWALIIFGAILLGAAIGISKAFDKVVHTTASVATYLIGILLVNIGCAELDVGTNMMALISLGVGILTLLINQTLILSFLSVIIISISLLVLITSDDHDFLIHLYSVGMTGVFTYVMLYEAKLVTKSSKLSKLYRPIRTGLLFSMLFGLIALGNKGLIGVAQKSMWISSMVFLGIVIYVVHQILQQLNIQNQKKKTVIYTLSVLILLFTIFAPSILGALLIILLCFLVNYATGVIIGIVALIYFISQYYYDLNYTLLTKSIILFFSGILFLIFYLLITKKSNAHEEV